PQPAMKRTQCRPESGQTAKGGLSSEDSRGHAKTTRSSTTKTKPTPRRGTNPTAFGEQGAPGRAATSANEPHRNGLIRHKSGAPRTSIPVMTRGGPRLLSVRFGRRNGRGPRGGDGRFGSAAGPRPGTLRVASDQRDLRNARSW